MNTGPGTYENVALNKRTKYHYCTNLFVKMRLVFRTGEKCFFAKCILDAVDAAITISFEEIMEWST